MVLRRLNAAISKSARRHRSKAADSNYEDDPRKMSSHHISPTTELNFELYFVTEVLRLRSLHYGYWDEERSSDRLDLDEIQRAQSRFTERLLSFVPPETKTILDVGAGIGDNACALSRSGHRVTAISPDRNHQQYFDGLNDSNIAFQRSTFEAFESAEEFDLILFSESHRYFDRRIGLERAHRLVRRGGHLLVSGMFRHADEKPFPMDFEVSDLPYIRMAEEQGFVPLEISDITSNVLPTVEIVHRAITDILEPTLRFAEAFVMARSPWKAKLFRFLFTREDKEFERALKKLRRKTDPDRFRERFRYATILFEAR